MIEFSGNPAHSCALKLAGAAIVAGLAALLAGCPSHSSQQTNSPTPAAQVATMHGTLYGGRQPIQGATVVAYAAGTALGAVPTQIGTAVTSGPGGNFTMTFAPAPTTGEVVYAVARGGIAYTGGSANPAIGLMTVAGIQGSTLAPVAGTVNINELTTVAATATLKHYIHFVDCATITGNTVTPPATCIALPGATGLAAKAATLARLVNVETGKASAFLAANSTTAGAPLTATLEKLDTLANVLAGCVNSSGPTSSTCTGLFRATGGNPDTLMAAWLTARMPAVNAKGQALYALALPSPVFAPTLAAAPASFAAGFWTIGGERYAYTANSGSNNVSEFRLTRGGGALAPVAGTSIAAGSYPDSVTVDPSGRYVYVANNNSRTVSMYAIGSNGALTAIGSPNTVSAGAYPVSVAVDPSGRYVYVADEDSNTVLMYAIGSNGALTAIGSPNTVSTGAYPVSVAVDPSGRYVYVANFGNIRGTVSMYAIGSNGALTAIGSSNKVSAGAGPNSVAVDPSGRYVYVANEGSNTVSMYAIGSNGALMPVSGISCGTFPEGLPTNCVAAGSDPISVAVDPSGRYVYVANNSGTVSMYAIGSNGALTAIGSPNTVSAGSGPYSVAVDPSGRYVYVANSSSSGTVSMYAIGAGGTLTPVAGTSIAAGPYPVSVAVDPSGRYVYVANSSYSGTVSMYALGTGGALSPVAGNACNGVGTSASNCVAAGSSPFSVAVDPSGRYAYVANFNDYTVSMYAVGAGGTLAPIGTVAAGYEPASAAVDPTGRYVYVANYLGSDVSMYTIGADGTLNPVTGSACAGVTGVFNCVTAGFHPTSVTVDPTGRYVYVTNSDGNDVSMYAIGAGGALSPVAGSNCDGTSAANCVAAGSGPFSVTVDPTGRYVYVANGGDDNVSMYTIGTGGALNPVAGSACDGTGATNCVAAGSGPFSVTVDPTGRYAYVANRIGDNVSMYTIGAGGALSPVAGSACDGISVANCVAAGDFPRSVTVDSTGHYVYVANQSGNDVSVYTIGAGGALTPAAGSACNNVTGVSNCVAAGSHPASVVVGP